MISFLNTFVSEFFSAIEGKIDFQSSSFLPLFLLNVKTTIDG